MTAGGPGIGVAHSSVDDAYNYYGMQNILDAGGGGGGGGNLWIFLKCVTCLKHRLWTVLLNYE